MSDDGPIPGNARTQALIALARIELDHDPATWPTSELGGEGVAAAALITDRLDLLPERLADPAELWRGLPRVFRMLVWQRNPALAVYAVHAASGGSRLG
jgi:hypothetical protein